MTGILRMHYCAYQSGRGASVYGCTLACRMMDIWRTSHDIKGKERYTGREPAREDVMYATDPNRNIDKLPKCVSEALRYSCPKPYKMRREVPDAL